MSTLPPAVTWPRSEAQLPFNVGDASYDPQLPFGWGLRTDPAKARLQSVRSSLSGDALAQLDALLAADDWNADGSVAKAGDVLARLASLAGAIGGQPFAVQDTIVSVARDIAQAAMLKRGIAANDSTLTAEHWSAADNDQPPFGRMAVGREEVVPPGSLTKVKPEEDVSGYTGNEGLTRNRSRSSVTRSGRRNTPPQDGASNDDTGTRDDRPPRRRE